VEKIYTNRFASCQSSCSLLAQIKVKNSNDTHASCLQIPANSGVVSRFPTNQSEINFILDLHNQIRSNVSFPNLNKNITTVYPTATDMRLEFEYLLFTKLNNCFYKRNEIIIFLLINLKLGNYI